MTFLRTVTNALLHPIRLIRPAKPQIPYIDVSTLVYTTYPHNIEERLKAFAHIYQEASIQVHDAEQRMDIHLFGHTDGHIEVQQAIRNPESGETLYLITRYVEGHTEETRTAQHNNPDLQALMPACVTHDILIQDQAQDTTSILLHQESTQYYEEQDREKNCTMEAQLMMQSVMYRFSDLYQEAINVLHNVAKDIHVKEFHIAMEDNVHEDHPNLSISMVHRNGHRISGEHAIHSIQHSKTCRKDKGSLTSIQAYLHQQRDGFFHIMQVEGIGPSPIPCLVRHPGVAINALPVVA